MPSDISVIGTGYVGLTTGACMAHLGHCVRCVDIDADKIERLRAGEIPIVEHGLEELVVEGVREGRLEFTTDASGAVAASEFVFLCVPTPQDEDGSADLSYVQAAAAEIGPHLRPESVVINKSTVPVGSTHVVGAVIERGDVFVVSNPEFLREGSAVQDFLHPDRVVIGCDDQAAAVRVASLYLSLAAPLIVTDPASAETIKYVANSFLATKLSYVNAVAAVCEAVGADIDDVILGIGYDKRIGHEFLRPGPGWGGSCFPKDTRALINIAENAGYDFELLKGVVAVNERQFDRLAGKIVAAAGGVVDGKRIAVWGLTFKAGTDDLRESPALEIIDRLLQRGAEIVAFDPVARNTPDGFAVAADPYEACDGAEVLAILTEWDEFRWLDFDRVAGMLASPMVVDARNIVDAKSLERRGFTVVGIGRS